MTIILTGLSGVGKTTIARILEHQYGFLAFDTGDMWKAKYSLALASEFRPTEVYKADRALRWFFESGHYARGMELYNQFKAYRPQMAEQICTWIEMDRVFCPDMPSRAVLEVANLFPDCPVVTSAINDEELGYLLDIGLPNPMVIKLSCSNRVERPADNRQEITLVTPGVDFSPKCYRIEQTGEVADHLARCYKERLNWNHLV